MSDKPTKELEPLFLSSAKADPEVMSQIRNKQVEHDHYSAIGKVASAWAYLEAIIVQYQSDWPA